ncbi:MAG: hypothetical protein AB7O43_07945 [Hyphomicrobiaceae bacterium]
MTKITLRTINTASAANDAAFDVPASRIDPSQWHQAVGIARQSCARIFRDGGSPADALRVFGLSESQNSGVPDWSKAVSTIAQALCATPTRHAA